MHIRVCHTAYIHAAELTYLYVKQAGLRIEGAGSRQFSFIVNLGVTSCRSETKFNSGCGWPAFYAEIPGTVDRHEDVSFGMKRVEITCSNCGGHLGHVFEGEVGGPKVLHVQAPGVACLCSQS